MNNEYIIVNKTDILKRIGELKEDIQYYKTNFHNAAMHETAKIKLELENLLSESTPLIHEIERAFDAGFDVKKTGILTKKVEYNSQKQNYISNLKLDI